MKLVITAILALVVLFAGCGGKSPTAPTFEAPTVLSEPAWRLDKTDALNYYLGHRPEDKKWGFGAVIWEGTKCEGRFTYNTYPGAYQHFRWDCEFIYLVEDWSYTGPGDDVLVSTSWTNFRLAPRFPQSAGVVRSDDNEITFWAAGCVVDRQYSYPIVVDYTFVEYLQTTFRVGRSPFYEVSSMAWKRGWFRWEYWKDGESKPRHESIWLGEKSGPEPTWGERCTP